jgi:hypothetical protein
VATDYRAKLAADRAPAAMASRVARAKKIYGEIGPWLRQYHGGFPVGYAAAAIQWESNGQMSAVGDASLGEIGFFQITSTFPSQVGIPAEARYKPEMNVFLGLLEYQLEAIRMHLAEPKLRLGSVDAWKMARFAFAIGSYGARTVMKDAAPRNSDVWDAVVRHVDRTGGRAFGSQSAEKVWYRVHTTDLVWDIGQRAVPSRSGLPRLPPQPPGYTYRVPASLAPYFHLKDNSWLPIAAAALGALLVLRYR